ncbi:uncharacterized protein HMF8227_00236 [Saliniradius amylolyticus]|uniref:Uncharacterized protein n=1 Tax=Saliniradius amylolyticus TaxID=2183582 RepID=A0A2S2DZC0_9ALTE|nr:sulfotransferase [Saliniradius amylolyticus]AWL10744.1 uncharacterized protein HMF8227_00236 [Saliniradius amylolyticus]
MIEAGDRLSAKQALDHLSSRAASPDVTADTAYWYCHLGDYAQAARLYQSLCEAHPDKPAYWYNLATTRRVLGELDAAEQALDRQLALDPADGEGQYLRSQLKTQCSDSNHVAELRQQLGNPDLPPKQRVHLYYALGKELEDIGADEQAFDAIARGGSLRRKYLKYDVAQDERILRTIRASCDNEHFARLPTGKSEASPIFILGLPRTGSTLVENILAAHSQVAMGGELNAFSQTMMPMLSKLTSGSVLDAIGACPKLDFNALGQGYLSATRHLQGDRPHLTDKLPLNFLYTGLIQKALPKAKIIHVRRHPMDAVWAIYKHLFTHAYPYSYDPKDIARYLLAYERLMEHWRKQLGERLIEVDYEALVTQPEPQMRRLLSACALPFESQCLDFFKQPRSVTTGSATQVRQPVYTSSVGRWKRFESQLSDVYETFVDAGLAMD